MNRLKGTKGDAAVCGYRVYIKGVKRGEGGKNTHGEGGEGGGLRRWSACRLLLSKGGQKYRQKDVHLGMRLAIKKLTRGIE
jgi:hypothetical protein